jgi:hypothetical protein
MSQYASAPNDTGTGAPFGWGLLPPLAGARSIVQFAPMPDDDPPGRPDTAPATLPDSEEVQTYPSRYRGMGRNLHRPIRMTNKPRLLVWLILTSVNTRRRAVRLVA